ncbi:hypothetical protein D3C73_1445200 [compost metagenome]
MRNAHIDLQALRQAVVAQLGQHGIQSPPVQREIYGPADLDAGALDALGTRFGITLCQAGRALQVSIPAATARLGA